MHKISPEPRVYLGKSSFTLKGLHHKQIQQIKSAWGPFLRLNQTEDDKTSAVFSSRSPQSTNSQSLPNCSVQESWEIHFKHEQAPPNLVPDYQRADDLFLSIQCLQEKRVLSWIDGSLGAIEASIQIVLQRTLAQRGGLLVHASAGIYQGQGILVPGPSGVGKSTVAREAGFDQVLSDEMVIVEKVEPSDMLPNMSYQIFSTPFWSEGRTLPLVMIHAPLSLICYPVKSTYSKLLTCNPAEAITHLLSAITLYELASASSQHHKSILFDITCHLCTSTLNQKLLFPKYGPWLHLLSWPKVFN